MKGFDYSQDNMFYITICVHDRICCFGEISVGTGRDLSQSKNVDPILVRSGRDLSLPSKRQIMVLNDFGKLAWKQWNWLAEQYPYVILHAFVVMPNHVHGIIEINRDFLVGTGRDLSQSGNVDPITFGTGHDLSLQGRPVKIKSLSEIIGAYKTTVSKQIHLLGYKKFSWQRSFHDHIICDERSYINITEYIFANPSKSD
jgi:hypothetical protein